MALSPFGVFITITVFDDANVLSWLFSKQLHIEISFHHQFYEERKYIL